MWDLTLNIVRDSEKRNIFGGFDRYSGGGIRQNLGTRCGIGKENGIWD